MSRARKKKEEITSSCENELAAGATSLSALATARAVLSVRIPPGTSSLRLRPPCLRGCRRRRKQSRSRARLAQVVLEVIHVAHTARGGGGAGGLLRLVRAVVVRVVIR